MTRLLVLLLSFACASVARADCPPSTVACGSNITHLVSPTGSASCTGQQWDAHYDLIEGLFVSSGSSIPSFGGGYVEATDRYTIVGLPTGTPIALTAGLRVTGSITFCGTVPPSGQIIASLFDEAGFEATAYALASPSICDTSGYCCGVAASLDEPVRMPLAVQAGSPFEVTSAVRAGVTLTGTATITGRLAFEDLPPGTTVVSCQGFRQDAPVPALPASWGGMKARYR